FLPPTSCPRHEVHVFISVRPAGNSRMRIRKRLMLSAVSRPRPGADTVCRKGGGGGDARGARKWPGDDGVNRTKWGQYKREPGAASPPRDRRTRPQPTLWRIGPCHAMVHDV